MSHVNRIRISVIEVFSWQNEFSKGTRKKNETAANQSVHKYALVWCRRKKQSHADWLDKLGPPHQPLACY